MISRPALKLLSYRSSLQEMEAKEAGRQSFGRKKSDYKMLPDAVSSVKLEDTIMEALVGSNLPEVRIRDIPKRSGPLVL